MAVKLHIFPVFLPSLIRKIPNQKRRTDFQDRWQLPVPAGFLQWQRGQGSAAGLLGMLRAYPPFVISNEAIVIWQNQGLAAK